MPIDIYRDSDKGPSDEEPALWSFVGLKGGYNPAKPLRGRLKGRPEDDSGQSQDGPLLNSCREEFELARPARA